jgi:glucosamine kinase
MVLIADSGSTKTDWRLIDDSGMSRISLTTEGLNPFFLSAAAISDVVREKVLPSVGEVDKVYFYGAGCGSVVKATQVVDALDETLNPRFSSEVSGDILGAARSLLQDEKGVACILGTGANSCLYDGRQIIGVRPSLGYMFSDWGSGTVMCKDLIAVLLQEKLPVSILEDFSATYGIETAGILDHIYNKPLPNRFIASFTPFLLKYADQPDCQRIIVDNLRKFFEYYVCAFPSADTGTKLSFTGSIAFSFKKYLIRVAEEFGFDIDQIVQHPMDGLVRYHGITVSIQNS